ncbi:TatD family hydrolase [Jiulongibacter sediminis]|mgnify:CR=1 FL=1|jgi:predicted metal-dependent TIM-barrel fold hydrolase|uniref:Hydrolase TatD n=1 Tax=Jiulongibacter sediminis TaxID=1605367 RepID=A0A0P7BMB7_9BACT|nr:TatD family hydrolase [Jiulongibacter sediminis]KPM48398.1 hydrolase TatD [Jiulongibacter sediminis]TBX24938.1 hydrolase TatD [Jiulongibacter sediminis]
MKFIDPHVHMTSRTTDDYEAMSKAGIVALIEPAFWLGQPRTEVGSFKDYYSSIVGWEPFRSSQFGIKHYCTIGLNSKEANNVPLAEKVMELLPLYALKDNVVAIGEIGYDDQTEAEDRFFRAQIELAKEVGLPIMIHTPHRDKKKGTLKSMDVLEEHGMDPKMVVIDHNNEETAKEVLDRGYWAAFTIYPRTKMGSERMVEVVKTYGSERIIVDSSADWGVSDPLAVPKTAKLMLENGISKEDVHLTTYKNALTAYSQSGNMKESDWDSGVSYDQSVLYGGNSVLRGQNPKKGSSSDFIEN